MKNPLKMILALFLAIFLFSSVNAAILGAPGWIAFTGTLSDSNQRWVSEPCSQVYSSAVLAYTFGAGEEFDVVAYWGHNYRATGMVYGTDVSHTNFGNYSSSSYGPYFGGLTLTGFPLDYNVTNNANYYGQYIYSSDTTPRYFRWNRTGNTISISYRDTLVTGSWINIITPATIASNQKVVVGLGEADYTETAPLQLISFYSTTIPEWNSMLFLFIGIVLSFGYSKIR